MKNIVEKPEQQQNLKLKGIIKKYYDENKKEQYLCLYLNLVTNQWLCVNTKKNQIEVVSNILYHNKGSIVMLFYSKV